MKTRVYRGDLAIVVNCIYLCLVGGGESFLGIILAHISNYCNSKGGMNTNYQFKRAYETTSFHVHGRSLSRIDRIDNDNVITTIPVSRLNPELTEHLEKFKQELIDTDFV